MYQIWKNKEIRPKTEYVIICQAKNTRETSFAYFNPLLIRSNSTYTWGEWQNYYMQDLKRRKLPCHYFVEYLDNDYVVYQGLSEEHPSYFIRELIEAGVVNSEYKNSILITVGENYNIDIPEYRMYEHLCSKCICSLMRRYKLHQERIVYFDARTKIHLQNYLKTRTDNTPALFVSLLLSGLANKGTNKRLIV